MSRRYQRRRLRRGLLAGLVVAAGVVLPATAHADEDTVSVDSLRTGWDSHEPALQPDATDFGQLFDTTIGGQIYAQPLVVGATASSPGTLIVAGESDHVYGLDPTRGTVRWDTTVGTPWPISTVHCGDVGTTIGVTSTPVSDGQYVYVMAKDNDGRTSNGAPDPKHPHWRLHALSISTGQERPGWPVTIGGFPDNDPSNAFNPKTAAQRPGLLLLGGVVYAGFASYCDAGPYVGYVAGVSTSTHQQTALWSAVPGTTNGEAGIWQSGGGLVSDGPGQILLTTGNGQTAPPGPGHQPPTALGEAVVRLTVGSDGKLRATDYFSPSNGTALNTDDTDLGSGAPMAIPGTYDGKRLLVQIGKDGRVFLLDRDDLGGSGQGSGGGDAVVGVTGPFNGIWGHPAYWPGPDGGDNQGGYVYDVENQGFLRAFQLSTTADGEPVLSSVGTSLGTFRYTSGSPVITSAGTTTGSALVWVVSAADPASGDGGELRAYDAVPHGGVLRLVWSSPISTPEKFTQPATDGNRVFVGTELGHVIGFGTPTAAAVEAAPTNFGSVPVGSTSPQHTVEVTATRQVEIDGVSTHRPGGGSGTDPFTITSTVPTAGSPTVLTAGQSLPVSLTLTPGAAGEVDEQLAVMTRLSGVVKTVYLDLFGTGTAPGFAANPASLAFGTVPTGARKTFTANIVNTGAATEHVTSDALSATSVGFGLGGGAATGTAIPPGGSIAIPVTYAPTSAQSSHATLTVTPDTGPAATVDLSGSAVDGSAALGATPNALQFPEVPVGSSVTRRFTLRNTGNIALTVTLAKAPVAPSAFTTSQPVSEGLQIPPGEAVVVPITFAPTKAGDASDYYKFNSDPGSGSPLYEVFLGTGTDPIAARYRQLGGRHSWLGKPLSPERRMGVGRRRRYRNGQIFWSAATGVAVLRGPILAHYLAGGGATGFAGFPSSDVRRTRDHRGHFARFTGSGGTVIYSSRRSGTWEVNGAIRQRWVSLGGVTSRLRYPTSDEYTTSRGMQRNDFQRGTITWNPRNGHVTVHYMKG